MCDSFAYLDEKGCWLAKNSDREPKEPQLVEWYDNNYGKEFQEATYIQVTTPTKRYATWLSRPDWMWGAEMGVNENGVAIANEAVFTCLINRKSSALLGMDLLRLGLEQSCSADEALAVITGYLQKYGQGGNAAYPQSSQQKDFFYDNSYLICDVFGGWQLETAGQYWVARKLDDKNPKIAISNDLSIGTDFDLCSDLLMDNARKAGYWNGKGDFNFRDTFASWFMPWAGKAGKRKKCNLRYLNELDSQQAIAPQLAQMLRSHVKGEEHSSNADVCMHATGVLRPSQTTQSMICHMTSNETKTWMTGGSAPCISLFKPIHTAPMCWLVKHDDFWKEWNLLYQKAEDNPNYKALLQQYNQQFEAQLWNANENETLQLLDEWWQKIHP